MACHKSLPPPPPAPDCGQNLCPCLSVVTTAADSATQSALASSESALLAHKLLQGCLSYNTIKPGGGLKVDENAQPGEGGIYVDVPSLIASGLGLEVQYGKLAVKAQDLAGTGLTAAGRKLNVNLASLVRSGGGLVLGADGKLGLDLSDMEATDKGGLTGDLIQAGGGLGVDASGNLFVDFATMPTDKFEKLLKSLRLQLWLTQNTDIYVNKSHASASDTLDEGRGFSPDKPFKTIQAAVTFVCDNYNFSTYNVSIHISGDVYEESVLVFDYNSSGGKLYLIGEDTGEEPLTTTIKTGNNPSLQIVSKEVRAYNLKYHKVWDGDTSAFAMGVEIQQNGTLVQERFELVADFGEGITSGRNLRPFVVAGRLQLQNNSSHSNGPSKIMMNNYVQGMEALFRLSGTMAMYGAKTQWPNIICSGGCSTFMKATGGYFGRNLGYSTIMGFSGEMSGKRYVAESGGRINTSNSGAEYFPGSIAGTVDASTYSWYK